VLAVTKRLPPEVDWTLPAPRELNVVEPVAENIPVTLELAKVDWPVTNRGPETVRAEVEALVTVKTLVPELKVKLELVDMEEPPPKRTSVEVRRLAPVPPLATGRIPVKVMLGVVPPEEAMLPEPVTLVT
jgi:hypothetical protein